MIPVISGDCAGAPAPSNEGVLTAGYPPAATERAVQAGIAAAGYAPYAASGG